VPAGQYARAALEELGWWQVLEGRVIGAVDVRAALRLVEMGEADAGVVYRTDAMASDAVVVVGAFGSAEVAPIAYPLAVVREAGEGASTFAAYLRGEVVGRRFVAAGFKTLDDE
jgi:molybdate transport system substrate-binding protein